MSAPLRVLILEDSVSDTELMLYELRSSGFEVDWQRVETEPDYLARLDVGLDVILSDFYMPEFDAMRALRLLQERGLDIPLIIVTGSISEEVAVECMKQGVADYLLKDRMVRLGQAVMHAVQEKKLRDEKRQAEAALKESEERFRRLADNAQDMIYRYRVTPPRGFEYISPAVTAMTGNTPQEYYADPELSFKSVHEDDRWMLQQWLLGEGMTQPAVLRWVRKDGAIIWTEHSNVAIYDEAGNLIAIEGIGRDITRRKQVEAQLLYNAFQDALTGLPNRALFMNRLRRALEYSLRHENYLFAVLFLDLDRFKVINDSLGHTYGDKLLIAIATRLAACLRPSDTAARLGGDEFTILLEGIKDISEVIRVADRIQAQLKLPFELGEQEVFTTASIGIALSATGYKRPEDLLRDADIAMYRAKSQGSARYEIFNAEMHAQAVARLQLETELRRAVERQEFQIHYQPIVALATGFITGFEALVRWQHPRRGLVHPTDFIPVAVETGLSIPIDRWVLSTACRQTQQWQEQFPAHPPLTISVNLCSPEFAHPDLIKHIDQILQETNLDAHSLNLEITESIIMENSESTTRRISQLRDLRIQLSIDDFGTGYSSLSRLHHFPINMLKIDRSFVSRMGLNSGNLEIVETIVTLAKKLGVDVTAEGVETKEQLARLRELNCEYGQGYFFSQPLDSQVTEALLMTKPHW